MEKRKIACQNTMNRVNTFGIQGDVANGQVPHYTPTTPRVAADETIYAGDFVWVSDTNGVATCAKASQSGKPTGIVQRVLDLPLGCADAASLQIPVGRKADVVVWGDMFVKTTDSAAVGKQYDWCNHLWKCWCFCFWCYRNGLDSYFFGW